MPATLGRAADRRPGQADVVDASDTVDLQRFVDAQDAGGTWETALAELRAGRKRTHWAWFVFRYALQGLAEARAYLAHPVLGPRLRASAAALLALPDCDPVAVLGEVDALKLRSSMTLFAAASEEPVFREVLTRCCGGPDPATTSRL
jgi:uncharacterized protein (DUF1810 family)